MAIQKIYWDTSCFIAYLSINHPKEQHRAEVCRDILYHAQNDRVELITSSWTMVESIRPRLEHIPSPPPLWAEALQQKDAKGNLIYPDATKRFGEIWEYYDKKHNTQTRKLTVQEATTLKNIFQYPFIKKVMVDPIIAARAAEIARDTKMRPADSLHVASALAVQCTSLQSWDGDYSETSNLIPFDRPKRLSDPNLFSQNPPPEYTGEGFLQIPPPMG